MKIIPNCETLVDSLLFGFQMSEDVSLLELMYIKWTSLYPQTHVSILQLYLRT